MNRKQVDQEELRVMFEDDKLSDAEIGQRIGLSKESAAALRRRRGFRREKRQYGRNRVPEAVLAECSRLLDEGYSYNAISSMQSIGESTLSKHFPGRGFTRRQSVEASIMARKLNRIEI